MEIAALKKDKCEGQEYWSTEQDANAILLVKYNEIKANYQTLEDEKKKNNRPRSKQQQKS